MSLLPEILKDYPLHKINCRSNLLVGCCKQVKLTYFNTLILISNRFFWSSFTHQPSFSTLQLLEEICSTREQTTKATLSRSVAKQGKVISPTWKAARPSCEEKMSWLVLKVLQRCSHRRHFRGMYAHVKSNQTETYSNMKRDV